MNLIPGQQVIIEAPGYPMHGKKGAVLEQRHVGPPIDMEMVGVEFGDWRQWFLPSQVRVAALKVAE